MPTSLFKLMIQETGPRALHAEIHIDGKRFGEEFVDLVELRRSALQSGAYELLTCGCGVAGCAGFFEPIFVAHRGDRIHWECDARYYPVVQRDEQTGFSVLRYEFDRTQYAQEIRSAFAWLQHHPHRDTIGPYGFDAAVFDEPFPDTSRQSPFTPGATIIVGYLGEYRQPWVWIDGEPDRGPTSLLPTSLLWQHFNRWAAMRDCSAFQGQCLYSKDAAPFNLRVDLAAADCDGAAALLAREIRAFWGEDVTVLWEEGRDEDRSGDKQDGPVRRHPAPRGDPR